jgi:hypothetical protein
MARLHYKQLDGKARPSAASQPAVRARVSRGSTDTLFALRLALSYH